MENIKKWLTDVIEINNTRGKYVFPANASDHCGSLHSLFRLVFAGQSGSDKEVV